METILQVAVVGCEHRLPVMGKMSRQCIECCQHSHYLLHLAPPSQGLARLNNSPLTEFSHQAEKEKRETKRSYAVVYEHFYIIVLCNIASIKCAISSGPSAIEAFGSWILCCQAELGYVILGLSVLAYDSDPPSVHAD